MGLRPTWPVLQELHIGNLHLSDNLCVKHLARSMPVFQTGILAFLCRYLQYSKMGRRLWLSDYHLHISRTIETIGIALSVANICCLLHAAAAPHFSASFQGWKVQQVRQVWVPKFCTWICSPNPMDLSDFYGPWKTHFLLSAASKVAKPLKLQG